MTSPVTSPMNAFAPILASLADLSPVAAVALGLVVGGLLGLAHFSTLWLNTKLYARGGVGMALALQLVRFAVLVVVFYGLARLGALPLLSGALALIGARALVVRRLGRLP